MRSDQCSSETWLRARGEACGSGDVINTMQIRSRRPVVLGAGRWWPYGNEQHVSRVKTLIPERSFTCVYLFFFFPPLLRLSPEMYLMIYKMQLWALFLTFHNRQFIGFWGFFFSPFGLFNVVYFIQEEFYTLRASLSVWWCPWLTVFWWPLVASLSLWSHKNTGGWERTMQGKGRRERFPVGKIVISCLL